MTTQRGKTRCNPLWLVGGLLLLVGGQVLVAADEPQTPPATFQATGVVQPAVTAFATADVSGVIVKLHVDVGDVVKEGDVLAELDGSRYQLELDQAQAKVNLAQARLNVVKAEIGEGDVEPSAARQRMAVAEAEVQLAKTALQLAERNLQATHVRVPIGGTVLKRHATVGQLVVPGQGGDCSARLFDVADLNDLEVLTKNPESLAGNVMPGQKCRVSFANTEYEGQVLRVGPVVDSRTGQFPIQVKITPSKNNTPLKPGTSVRVIFDGKK